MDEMGLDEVGVDELDIGWTDYWMKWELDELGIERTGIGRTGTGQSGNGRSGSWTKWMWTKLQFFDITKNVRKNNVHPIAPKQKGSRLSLQVLHFKDLVFMLQLIKWVCYSGFIKSIYAMDELV